ncbi:MAG: methylmalonyl-CoA mutase family protein [Actinobacteria bacterium]|nr:methylmalonyl-CoA mutase family protein [Actinomycetota bacterium]MCG2819768.1 methylmalonyl-CoA mutase family protein [Actinomycetes bacterium]MBU4219272.1 methylmalonyl-CoA mutase family protein [Actinomycetota bacterium]MBU4359556.1 methylmalonyl-CoA mutase family protein [Actinomycetota bacterium]MBU4390846.1 methylmalonyl-CoA mutase family protein [Actinomycetota bacterium]
MDGDSYQSEKKRWLAGTYPASGEGEETFTTVSGEPVDPLYGPGDVSGLDYMRDLGFPGEYPYTRGIHPSMYRGRLWTMRQFSGFGTARETNERFKFLLGRGQTGLSVAFDMPTIMGRDSDDPMSEGEVGRCGVAIDSVVDMQTLFDGIPLDRITTSMTTNAPASILLAFYLVTGERQGVGFTDMGGTIQNDILKEYIAQKSWIFPPGPSLRIITDVMRFCASEVPRFNTISISGYHIREAGSTAAQELAFTLADGMAYVQAGIDAGMNVDEFAPRLSFFFNSHIDFFEEVAKYRAARRIWARVMKERFGARKEESLLLRFHTQTAGCSLTAQQPENNIMRTAYEGLAAVLGGTQSLHTNSMDEVLALPTEKSVEIALRTQQVIAFETGVANTIDPLAGSYYVEYLTDRLESEALAYFDEIEAEGGVLEAIEKGYFQRQIADASYRYQLEVERGERVIVGVNRFTHEDEKPDIELLKIDPSVEPEQIESLRAVRRERDGSAADTAASELRRTAEGSGNLMPAILECARAHMTQGEIVDVMKELFGEYRETPVY